MEGILIHNEKLKQLYAAMLKWRLLQERSGKPARRFAGKDVSIMGQEATLTGCAIDLLADDVIASPHPGMIADFMQRLPPLKGSRRSGMAGAATARCTQLRSGLAAAKKMKREGAKNGNVVVAFAKSSPGKISSGKTWVEALRLAGIHSLPIVFVEQDTVGDKDGKAARRGGKTIRGMCAVQNHKVPILPVDGNDAVAVYRVAYEAIRRARQNGGPTLIECKPYRVDGRPDIDAASMYAHEDPIEKMEMYLARKGLFPKGWKSRLVRKFLRGA